MENPETTVGHLERLRPFVKSATTLRIDRNRLFSACLRASFSKAFEFVDFAFNQADTERAFFVVAGLRSICEDIIYLSFGAGIGPRDRETMIKSKMLLELDEGIRRQADFFNAFRVLQPVLSGGVSGKGIDRAKTELCGVWRANGWPNMKKGQHPTTRDIANKVDPGLLGIVYNYFFRLTSKMVHFSPQHLLRTGWGPDDFSTTAFSTTNMGPYFTAVAQIYGAFLFCLYFEYFGRFLRPGPKNQRIVASLRKDIVMHSRWPEMITFEEMNMKLPDTNLLNIVGRFMLTEQTKFGFLRAARR